MPVIIDGRAGEDVFDVRSTPVNSLSIRGSFGADKFHVSSDGAQLTADLDGILGPLYINWPLIKSRRPA